MISIIIKNIVFRSKLGSMDFSEISKPELKSSYNWIESSDVLNVIDKCVCLLDLVCFYIVSSILS